MIRRSLLRRLFRFSGSRGTVAGAGWDLSPRQYSEAALGERAGK